jgi:alkanesulfonate monooxygenase SsuD/methylene tetrahydromethanopterin reductase-like flavin-dependent oxidoreductase (luciferase family)
MQPSRGNYIVGDPASVAAQAQGLFDMGLDEIFFFTDRLWTPDDIALLAEVVDRIARGRLI